MRKSLKATLGASVVGVAGLVVLAIWFGALDFIGSRPQTDWTAGPPRIEMMPPDSPVYLEKHYPGPDGKDLKTEIAYRNGDRGVKLYRKDNTLERWDIEYKLGGKRLHAQFAPDGKQVVLGYEYRNDRTLQWKAETKDGVVHTTTYWFDGTAVFSVANQKVVDPKVTNDTVDVTYFRRNGKMWVHQIYSKINPTVPLLEDAYDADGKRIYVRALTDKGATTVTYYRPDSTAAFKQTWTTYSYYPYGGYGYGYGDEGGYMATSTVLNSIEVYAADGKTVSRLIQRTDNGSSITTVTDFNADGTKTVYSMSTTGDVMHIDKQDKDGRVLEHSTPKGNETKLEIPAEQLKELPTTHNPVAFWKGLETDPTKRNTEAP